MFQWLRQSWQELKNEPPGSRFQAFYRRRQQARPSPYLKPMFITLGTVILLAGVVMLVTPGPGVLAVVVGAGLLARESYYVAVGLDALEIRLRRLGKKT
jgi:hypothetical protein